MRFPSRDEVERIRKVYLAGTRVELVRMEDAQAPPIGTRGTVIGVDDTASIMVRWDNGSGLHVVYGEDECRKLHTVTTICYGKEKVWDSYTEAQRFFRRAIAGSEGSERERYTKIYAELAIGKSICTDGEEN